MLFAYRSTAGRLARLTPEEPRAEALWIDLFRPQPEQVAEVEALGVSVPTIEEMEEIEISSRLYRENGADYMTVVIPGDTVEGVRTLAPVTFILGPDRLVTVRHHTPRPFETFPAQAGRGALDCGSVEATFLALADEIIARFADILEEIGGTLDRLSTDVFADHIGPQQATLRQALKTIGRQGERVGRVRLGLLSMERALTFFGQTLRDRSEGAQLADPIKALQRDISALGVHADFVYSRISLVDDATLGMISLEQNGSVRIFSVVAALFMPPTLVASVYGMNFRAMPELDEPWGYPAAIALMVVSAALTYLFFKWKKWL